MESMFTRADASSSSCSRWSVDVFLSFRGEDTRSNFTSHLDMALHKKGINVFIDYKLPRSEDIAASLLKTIEESMISIVIISETYGSSSWCLDELVKIIECMKSKGQIVFPIFYKVDPSDVRKQAGKFGEELAKHQVKHLNKMQAWKEALAVVSCLSGWVLRKENEAGMIQEIVQEVLIKLNRRAILHVAKYPVGIDSQVVDLLSHVMSDGITMVGIYGIGGMGKTTLAKALYNKVSNQFEGCCFLTNVREASKQFGGLVQQQETLLSEILLGDLKVDNLDRGINIIRDRLHSKKSLIVLDDVDERQQLQALAGGRDWFGPGSKIIVTTRNKHLLSTHGFDMQYNIQKLNDDQALELFSWHAFKKSYPSSSDCLDLSKCAVDYCKGLPLALEVLGSFLNSRDQSKWRSILDGYEKSSLDIDIRKVLQTSYDGLEEQVKEIFLYTSCFFIGERIDNVKIMLEACCSYPDKGIINLMDLSLLTVENSKVRMHELIQQMGLTIALSESSKPRKRKRLLIDDDIIGVLNGQKKAKAVKAMKLNFPKPTELDIDAQAFRNVENLILLIVQNATSSKDLEYLPDGLKWINWSEFPFSSLPQMYTPKHLIQLNMRNSSIKHLGKGFMNCESLKHVDLSYSKFLEEIPDFSTALNLEELNLRGCANLIKVHESVGSLGKLVNLIFDGCSNLEQLPSYLRLKSLKYLTLGGCKMLEQFPHIGEEMKSSKYISIYLSGTAIKELPPSIEYLKGLDFLDLDECTNLIALPNTIYCLSSLDFLNVSDCSSLSTFPFLFPCSSSLCFNLAKLYLKNCNISNASFLETLSHAAPLLIDLDLSGNKFSSLTSCIVNFTSLRYLRVIDCKLLQEIPKVPTRVDSMNARGCISLTKFPDNIIDMISCDLKYEYDEDKERGYRQLVLMNSDVPKWLSHQNMTNSITFGLRSKKLRALAPCVVFKVNPDPAIEMDKQISITCKILINSFAVWSSAAANFSASSFKYMWLLVIDPPSPNVDGQLQDYREERWKDITVSFEVSELHKDMVTIRNCGVHVVEEEPCGCS